MNWRESLTPCRPASATGLFVVVHPELYGKSDGLSLDLLNGVTSGEPIVVNANTNSARIGSVVCSRLTKPGKSHEPMTGYMPCPALKARHQRTRTSPRPSG